MTTTGFFDEHRDQSEVKARIIQKYFFAWAKVITSTAPKIGYMDLYAGPGRYKDGAASTPLLILQETIKDPVMSKVLVAHFNDIDRNHTATLQSEIDRLPGIEMLKNKPVVTNGRVDEDAARFFNEARIIPSFTFVDPFGYKGLSLRLINGVIKDWGCECVFFFNYNRINAGISNPVVDKHVDALFGEERAARLRAAVPSKRPDQREKLIYDELTHALRDMGGEYVLPFHFMDDQGNRTSHSLVFVTKHFKGYDIMKDIMAKESSIEEQGVPSFRYSPAERDRPASLFPNRPLDDLEGTLPMRFAGRTLRMYDIYERHTVNTRYIRKNYKAVLSNLADAEKITTDRPPRKGSFANDIVVTFPPRKGK